MSDKNTRRSITPHKFATMIVKHQYTLRRIARRIPGLRPLYHGLQHLPTDVRNTVDMLRLRAAASHPFRGDPASDVIVSLTSFPARIRHAWIPIETMFHQDKPPHKVVLVLSKEEFPDKVLPNSIRQQQSRGLEILWTPRNNRSFQKLLPTRRAYPHARIVTIDDDIFYEPWTLSQLIAAADDRPRTIVGHRGWIVTCRGNELLPYICWPRANTTAPVNLLFLTGVSGVLYPPGIVDDSVLFDIDLAEQLCPTADDIWFWAVAMISNAPKFCLGNHRVRELRQQRSSQALNSLNWHQGQNDVQLKNVLDYFDLWRLIMVDDVTH